MTVDYRSLFVRVQRGAPNHLTPTHTLCPPRQVATTHDRIVVFGHQAAVTCAPGHHDQRRSEAGKRYRRICTSVNRVSISPSVCTEIERVIPWADPERHERRLTLSLVCLHRPPFKN